MYIINERKAILDEYCKVYFAACLMCGNRNKIKLLGKGAFIPLLLSHSHNNDNDNNSNNNDNNNSNNNIDNNGNDNNSNS